MDEDAMFPASAVDFIGPIERHDVVVNGYRVPFLSAAPMIGGRVSLTLDDRFALDVDVQDADRVVTFIADCIAVAMGYTAHPRPEWNGPIARSPFVKMTPLSL